MADVSGSSCAHPRAHQRLVGMSIGVVVAISSGTCASSQLSPNAAQWLNDAHTHTDTLRGNDGTMATAWNGTAQL